MTPDATTVIYIFGEGKTDIGQATEPEPPDKGIVAILTHTLCGKPPGMRVQRRPIAMLEGKGLWQKVRFAKHQAHGRSAGAVFAKDSEGGTRELQQTKADLKKGRDSCLAKFPMAIGVAHPCIESWLLADGPAIRQTLKLPRTPTVPDKPEELPAPRQDSNDNPKEVLRKLAGATTKELPAKEMDGIAKAMNDMDLMRKRCPLGFAPFADEVDEYISPLFSPEQSS